MDRRNCLRLMALGLPAIPLLSSTLFPTTVADRVNRAFRTPGPQPSGVHATRDGIWTIDQRTNRASLHAFRGWGVIRELETTAIGGSDITYDGMSLWIVSSSNNKLIKVDAKTGETQAELDTPGSGPVKWSRPASAPMVSGALGAAWRKGEIFLSVPAAAKIFVVASRDGAVVRSIPSPGIHPHGLSWDPDGSLWCADSIYRAFFKLDPASGKIIKQHMLPFSKPEVNGKVVISRGISIWQRYIYFCVSESAEVYRTPLVNRTS